MRHIWTVYRLIGPCESLLYVGCTTDLSVRTQTHRRRFGSELVRVEVEHYATRREGMDAERKAIRSEDPHFNVQHSPRLRAA